MNWEATQAIAELTAALAVLVSLVYLAAQVRQNTASIQSSTVARTSEILNRLRNEVWTDADSARVYELALSGEEVLDAETSTRIRLFWVALARDYEAVYYQHLAGQMPEPIWEGWLKEIRLVFSTPGGMDALAGMRDLLLESRFVALLDAELEAVDEPPIVAFRARWDGAGRERRAGRDSAGTA